MAAYPKRICWDACSWIALIQKERIQDKTTGKIIEDRYSQCRPVIDLAEKGKVEIITSGFCFVEVCKNPGITSQGDDQIAAFFEHDYIITVPVNRFVGIHARRLMLAGYSKLKPPDATHLATAIVSNADELHTFDEKLLDLDGQLTKLDGTLLKICKPAFGGEPLPLLEAAREPETTPDAEAKGAEATPVAAPEVSGDSGTAGMRPEEGDIREQPTEDRPVTAAKDQAEKTVEPEPPKSPPPPAK